MARMKVCMVTSTRADWGLLTPLARALREHPGVDLRIVATNMHLLEDHGMTINEILDAGFTVDARVPMDVAGERPADKVLAMSRCMAGMAEAFSAIRPNARLATHVMEVLTAMMKNEEFTYILSDCDRPEPM
ncbi:MAG: hypothetical protein UHP27_06395, partial [Muribaculaceae bacterium]|nr:hypothetical protein [Muribaculaceae bacterium]